MRKNEIVTEGAQDLARLQLLLQQTEQIAKTGSWELDPQSQKLYWSDGVFHILGYEPQSFEVDFEKGLSVIHPDDREAAIKHFDDALKTGRDYSIVKRFITADGSIRHIRSTARPLKNGKGEIVKMIGVFRDITEQETMVNQLHEKERYLEAIISSEPECVKIVDSGGILLDMNIAGLQMLDTEECPENVMGKPVIDVVHPDDREHFVRLHQQALKGQRAQGRFRVISLKNVVRHMESISVPLKDFKSDKVNVLSVTRDVTSNVRAEQDLKHSEQRFKALVQDGTDLIGILNPDGDYLYVSPTSTAVLGISPEEFIGRNAFDYIHPDDVNAVKMEFDSLAQKKKVSIAPFRFTHKNGTWRWLETTAVNLLDDPAVGGIITNSRDITFRKETEDKLKETLAALSERVKEQQCLNRIALLTNLDLKPDKILEEAVREIPLGWQFSDLASVYINFDGKIYSSPAYKTGLPKQQTVKFCIGNRKLELVVAYNIGKKAKDAYPFLNEEQALLESIAETLVLGINQQLLKESNERILNVTEEGIYGVDEFGNCNLVNPAASRMLGYTKDELLGKNMHELIHHSRQDGSAFKEKDCPISKAWKKGDVCKVEEDVFWHKNGNPIPVKYTSQPVIEKGKTRGGVVVFHDITEAKEAALQLTLSEKRFRALVQEGSDLIAIVNTEGDYMYTSPSYEHFLGLKEEELRNKNAFGFIHQEDVERVLNEFNQWPQLIKQKSSPYRFKHQKYGWRWLQSTGTVLLDDGVINGIVVNSVDITELMEAQERLKESEARYRGFYESQSNYVIRTDMNGNYSYVNKKFKEDFSWMYDGGEFSGKNSMTSICESHHEAVIDTVNNCVQHPETVFKVELDKPTRDGGRITTLWEFICVVDADGNPFEIQCVGIDITDRIAFERELKASNERYEYINMVSNDAIYEWDIVHDVFHWGEGFQRVFGHETGKEPFGVANWNELVHPDYRMESDQMWKEFLRDKKAKRWIQELQFMRADGTFAYVEEIGYLIRDAHGKPQRMIGLLRDVTEKKLIEIREELLKEVTDLFRKEEDLGSVLSEVLCYLCAFAEFESAELWLSSDDDNYLNLITSCSKDGTPSDFHVLSTDYTKFSAGQGLPGTILNKRGIEIWNDIDKVTEFIRREAAGQSGLQSVLGIPLFFNERVIGVLGLYSKENMKEDEHRVGTMNALSQLLGREINRKQNEEEMQLLFTSAPEVMAIASPNGHFVKVNPAFSELLGYTHEELTSRPFSDFLHPDDLETTKAEYAETISGERNAENFVNRYISKQGEIKYISWKSSNVFGNDGYVFAFGRDVTDLRELERLLQNAARLARIGSWEFNFISNVGYYSQITKEIHEVDDDFEPDIERAIKFYPENVRPKVQAAMDMAIEKGTPWDLELPIITAKGNLRWVRTIGEAEFREGVCVRLYGSFQDVHRQKMADLEIKRILEQRNNILESIGDAFFAVDRQWLVTYWNKEAEILLGRKRSEIVGQNLWKVYADAMPLKFYTEYHKAVDTGKMVHFEEYYSTTNQWFEVSAYPSEFGLSVYFKDVSIRKYAEQQINQSNERFEKVTEATNDAIWDWDIVEDTKYYGGGFKTLFGYNISSISNMDDFWKEAIHPDEVEAVLDDFESAVRDPDCGKWQREYHYIKADGNYALVIDRAVFIRDKHGKAIRAVGAMTDISYRKEHEASLRRLNASLAIRARELATSNAELEQFAYVASHDLQEPLRMVSSFLTQLEKKYGDKLDDKARQYIHFAVDGSQRMRQIILDLLEFSRVGKFSDPLESIALEEVVEDVKKLLHRKIDERAAIIHVAKLPTVNSYRTPLTQVFQNLISNAIKYSPEGKIPEVRISAKQEEKHWRISVSDKGIGIHPEYHDKIFVIFQRLHAKDQYSGTGMGLAIVKKNIESLGGRIWLDSEEGEGSTFYFTIPKTD